VEEFGCLKSGDNAPDWVGGHYFSALFQEGFLVNSSLVRLLVLVVLILGAAAHAQTRSLIVITDMEPDDRMALMLLAVEFPADIVFVGTTGMHAGLKQVLAGQLLSRLGVGGIPVIQGSGGTADSYPDIASSRAAREYRDEGAGLLPADTLAKIKHDMPRSSDELRWAIRDLLWGHDGVEIVLLAPPTDLVDVLETEPALRAKIGHIYMMGGWSQKAGESGERVRRSTYNWNMAPEASAKLMAMTAIPMTLYSSDVIKAAFAGGSITKDSFPEIIDELREGRCRVPAFAEFLSAAAHWNHHVMATIPALKTVIGDNADHQFTPADPVVVVGMARPDFIVRSRPVAIRIDLDDRDPARGYRVRVTDDPASRIDLVEALAPEIFRQQLLLDLRRIAKATSGPVPDGCRP
jgi:inosine-uridine nucleoside N-ribohydrolase